MAFPEILAPAGSFEALTAAVRCGADAVYIGGKNFSARQSAANFSTHEMTDAARMCHLHGVKLYLTVNTILLDDELRYFAEYIKAAAKAGIDACIVQDVGAADIIHKIIPEMHLHASTQMTIHTAEGAMHAKEHGFSRVVVARELSREEIKPILECGIEVEQFVHGALCMSVSGQCLLSAMIGSRSANRGRCAQACRLPFSACGKNGICALSLKDLSLVGTMDKLMSDGVHSLKIEGRMKRPEYVAAAVTALRIARSGEKPDMETLRAVFSRSGFTDGYYTGKTQGLFGVREKEDVTSAAAVLPKLRELYRRERVCSKLDISAELSAGKPFSLTGTDSDGNSASVYGEIPEPAKNRPSDEEQLKKQLSKLGDTIYSLGCFKAECDGVSMLPASSVNALRRRLTEELDSVRIEKNSPHYSISGYEFDFGQRKISHSIKPKLRFRVRNAKQLAALSLREKEECVIPLDTAKNLTPKENFILQMPRFTPDEKEVMRKLETLFDMGYRRLLCENPAHIRMGRKIGFSLLGGTDLHTVNSASAAFYENDGIEDILLSPELTLKQAGNILSKLPLGIYAYGRLPVMLMRCCPIKNETDCKNCTGSLTDRTRRKFPVLCGKDYTELLNSVPIWTADKMTELSKFDFILIDITAEKDSDEIGSIADAYREESNYRPIEFTRGLLYRGIESIKKGQGK